MKQRGRRGDPRSGPGNKRRTTHVRETCGFYGERDGFGQCRRPRSCQDCLAMEGCVLSPFGRCEDAAETERQWASDYHLAIASTNVSAYPLVTNAYNSFFAANATYCAASDAVCSKCRTLFSSLTSSIFMYSISTQFCVGAGGCVCVAVCEVPWREEWVAYDYTCDQERQSPTRFSLPKTKPIVQKSTRRDPRAAVMGDTLRSVWMEGTCKYLGMAAGSDNYYRPRSCQECLEQQNCLLKGFECTDMAEYDPRRDFRTLPDTAGLRDGPILYPSVNTTYCSASDATCMRCRERFTKAFTATFEDELRLVANGSFCVGENGCVCIELCEVIRDGWYGRSISSMDIWVGFGIWVVLVLVWIIVACCLRARSNRRQRRRTEAMGQPSARGLRRHMLDPIPVLSRRLDLFGWRDFYDRLLDKERALLRGEDNVSPMAVPVHLLFAVPSAPELDEEEDPTAPTVTDPRALASAPIDGDHETVDTTLPSAPTLDEGW